MLLTHFQVTFRNPHHHTLLMYLNVKRIFSAKAIALCDEFMYHFLLIMCIYAYMSAISILCDIGRAGNDTRHMLLNVNLKLIKGFLSARSQKTFVRLFPRKLKFCAHLIPRSRKNVRNEWEGVYISGSDSKRCLFSHSNVWVCYFPSAHLSYKSKQRRNARMQ